MERGRNQRILRICSNEDSRREAVRRKLDLVLSSAGFARNNRQPRFLRFLVERHLDGRDNGLKESVIAVEVFGRYAGYDPKLDGVVRTEVMRFRTRLDRYYADEGSTDPLVIELPKGGYRPVFRQHFTAPPVLRIGSGVTRAARSLCDAFEFSAEPAHVSLDRACNS